MTNIQRLEIEMEKATTGLAVAEEFAWAFAFVSGVAVYLAWDSALLAIPLALLLRYVAVLPYSRKYETANDAWERATGTGKYLDPSREVR